MSKSALFSCELATRLIVEREYRTLARGPNLKLRLHLLMCRFCRRFVVQMRYLSRGVRKLHAAPSRAPGLSTAARERMRDALQRNL